MTDIQDIHDRKQILIAVGSKENITEDIHSLSEQLIDNPALTVITGKEMRNTVIEIASALFLDENLVLVLVDPDKELIHDVRKQMHALKERIHIIIYLTAPPSEGHKLIEGKIIVMEQKKERRIEEKVRGFIRKYEKKMTHEAFRLLVGRIRDESVLESELTKLVTYVGERRDIKSKDVLAVGVETHEESLITLFDALAKKNKKEAITIFENLLLNGFNILAIHSFLVKQIRLLLQAKDMEEIFKASPEYAIFAKTFGKWKDGMEMKPLEKKHYLPFQKPYYAYNLSKISQRMSKKDLIAFFDMLAAFDVKVKSGTKHERALLEQGLIGA
ncbi:MAG: hypothetical protein C0392_03790 [Syntrophus sp. (in: bacteria)]|nr:hypothetical protein [Syntrophus sp. (in: bacteria)]